MLADARTTMLAPALLVALVAGALPGTSTPARAETEPTAVEEALADGDAGEPAAATGNDPLETVNRGVFWINDTLDVWVLAPAARGWNWLAPDPLQQSITNFFANLRMPVNAANNLLQGKFAATSDTLGRFVINSSVGLAGLFDPAEHWGIDAHPEDFGQTLGRWGSPPGLYLMLPLLGPTTLRDGGGMVVDWGFSVTPLLVPGFYLTAASVVNTVNGRAAILQEVDDAKAASLDYYAFVRNAYLQRRAALIRDIELEESSEVPDDLYDTLWDDE